MFRFTSISGQSDITQPQCYKLEDSGGSPKTPPAGIAHIRLLALLTLFLTQFAYAALAIEILPFEGNAVLQDAQQPIAADSPALKPGKNIRIAFYNIEMFTDGIKDGKSRKESDAEAQARDAAGIIDDLAVEVIIFSEVENERVMTMLNNELRDPYPYGFVTAFGDGSSRNEKMNLGVLSRFQPESVKEIDFGALHGKGRPTRGLLRVVVPLSEEDFLVVYAAHLKSNWGKKQKNYSQRVNAMNILRKDAEALAASNPDRNWEFMVVGDFNTDPLTKSFHDDPTLTVLDDWVDLWSRHPDVANIHTVPTRYGDKYREFPPALFDRVIIHPALDEKPWTAGLPKVIPLGTVKDVNVRPGEQGHVSDHYPIIIELAE